MQHSASVMQTSAARRRVRGDIVDPVHEKLGDDSLRLLAPVLGFSRAPDLPTLAESIEQHTMRSARPGGVRFRELMELLDYYCDQKGGDWRRLGEQLRQFEF